MRNLVFALVVAALAAAGCKAAREEVEEPLNEQPTVTGEEVSFDRARERMVESQIRRRGVKDERVLAAMAKVKRHLFVPERYRSQAYNDYPLPIGEGQTISQPYIVGFMTEILDMKEGDKVLEVGTGSGYQAAVLGELVEEVYTIEILPKLGEEAAARLNDLGYKNVHVKIGDGYQGWPEHAPFDEIIVTAAPEQVPQPLIDQLKEGGRMVIPVGEHPHQELKLLTKKKGRIEEKSVIGVLFVPMTGEAERRR